MLTQGSLQDGTESCLLLTCLSPCSAWTYNIKGPVFFECLLEVQDLLEGLQEARTKDGRGSHLRICLLSSAEGALQGLLRFHSALLFWKQTFSCQ